MYRRRYCERDKGESIEMRWIISLFTGIDEEPRRVDQFEDFDYDDVEVGLRRETCIGKCRGRTTGASFQHTVDE